MKRLIVSLMVVAGALLSACTEEEEFLQTAGLAGAYDLALVDYPEEEGADLLFVTSTDNNELRVLSLGQREEERRFIRAPNPLQPLAIPVLPRPQALTRDVRYDENGAEQTGRLVFARSSGSTQISVVSAERDVLREVRRLETTRMTGTSVGPVTAFAARAPEQPDGSTTLYFATQETTGARLWWAQLPPRELLRSEEGLGEEARTEIRAEPLPGLTLPPSVAVNSLLVLPGPVGQSHRGALAVATRGAAGTVYSVNLGTEAAPTVETRELNFGGAQVLQLATHGRVQYEVVRQVSTDPVVRVTETQTVEAGERIFGILDPSNCGVPRLCTGVLAVDAATGQVANARTLDEQGNPVRAYDMLPISSGSGLPTGLALSTNMNLLVQSSEAADQLNLDPNASNRRRSSTLPVLGVVPLSNGTILFFDAVNLIHLNIEALWGTDEQPNTPTYSATLVSAQGVTLDADVRDEIGFAGTYGVTRDQTYVLTYQGVLPDMAAVRRDGDAFRVPAAPRPGRGQVVQPGDRIVLLSAATGGQTCTSDVTVLAVQPAGDGLVTLVPSGNLPADCAGFEFFQVRAAGPQPLVLSSSSEDYLQRLGSGDEFSRTGAYFFIPPGYQGQTENLEVRLNVIRQNLDAPTGGLSRGDRYVVTTDAHFFPYIISVNTSAGTGEYFGFRLPGSAVLTTVGSTDYAYIAYPSANGILEVNLMSITAGLANSVGLFPYL